jgi:hypothetical protein
MFEHDHSAARGEMASRNVNGGVISGHCGGEISGHLCWR